MNNLVTTSTSTAQLNTSDRMTSYFRLQSVTLLCIDPCNAKFFSIYLTSVFLNISNIKDYAISFGKIIFSLIDLYRYKLLVWRNVEMASHKRQPNVMKIH